jgi:hypothetical protein
MKTKTLQIRNSTAEFLIFTKQENKNTIEVRIEDETVWLTQKLMSVLFEVSVPTINEHCANIFKTGEVSEAATVRKFRIVQTEGARQVNRDVDFYNLDAIIAVGFRVNSERATQFRQWAINILRDFVIRGYVLDKERLKNGSFFNQEYFDNLLPRYRAGLWNGKQQIAELKHRRHTPGMLRQSSAQVYCGAGRCGRGF